MIDNNKVKYFRKFIIFLSIGVILLPSSTALAFDEGFYSSNDILFYDPRDGACDIGSNSSGSVAGEADPSRGLSSLQAGFVDKYHDIAVKLGMEYGIPWETPMAQGILESAAGTSQLARERNNFFGIGAFDSDPDKAFHFSTPEEGWRGYFENIRKTPTYKQHGAFNYPGDPVAYANAIKEAGYATDPAYVSKLEQFIKAIQLRTEEKGWKSSATLVQEHPEILENAKKNAGGELSKEDKKTPTSDSLNRCEGTGELKAGGVTTTEEALLILKEFIVYVKEKTSASIPDLPSSAPFNKSLGTPGKNFYKMCDGVSCGQCTALSMWFVNHKTSYKSSGNGNGVDVVHFLGQENRDKGLKIGDEPQPYSIFSWKTNKAEGHTGVVVGVLDDGGIVTIENNVGSYQVYIGKYTKEQYKAKDPTFAYVGDKLK